MVDEIVLNAMITAYNNVFQKYTPLDASTVDDARRRAMLSAVSTLPPDSEITRLEEELAASNSNHRTMGRSMAELGEANARLEGDVAMLRAALKPFSYRALNPNFVVLSVDCRAAREALASTGPEPIAERSMGTISEIKLQNRPVAFRARNKDSDVWALTIDEEAAARFANESGTEYQGLYVRDGTPRPDEISEAVAKDPADG